MDFTVSELWMFGPSQGSVEADVKNLERVEGACYTLEEIPTNSFRPLCHVVVQCNYYTFKYDTEKYLIEIIYAQNIPNYLLVSPRAYPDKMSSPKRLFQNNSHPACTLTGQLIGHG